MQSVLVLLLALVAASAAQTMINLEFEFFNRFGNIKAKQACFGMDQATEQHRRVDAAIQTCFPKFNSPAVAPSDGVESLFTLFRKRRSARPRFSAGEIGNIKKDINEEVEYFRCVMQQMGITDIGNNLNVDAMVANVQSMNVAEPLKAQLSRTVTECYKYAHCVPVGKDPYPVPNDVVQVQHYLFCEQELRSLACVKNDVRYIVDQFDLKGTDGRLDFTGSDSEKVTALLFANAVVGPDDFGLYE